MDALKGQKKKRVLHCPYRAKDYVVVFKLRALPWAKIFWPFRP